MQQMARSEQQIRLSIEEKREITESRDVLKTIMIEKIKLEFDAEQKWAFIQIRNPLDAKEGRMLERTQIMDSIFIKYNLKLSDLIRAEIQHKIEADPDMKALRASQQRLRLEKKKEFHELMKLSEDQEKLVWEGIKQAGMIRIQDTDGLMDFNSLQKVHSTIQQLAILVDEQKRISYKTKRRALLQEKKDAEY